MDKDVKQILAALLRIGSTEKFSERIRLIRASTGLSRAAFAKKIGVAAATMDGIENKDRTPRGDLLEKITREYPSFGMYLITGTYGFTIPQLPPVEDIVKYSPYEFIDEVDARYMDECTVKPSSFKKLYLVQSSKNESDLGAIITVGNEIELENRKVTRAVWVKAGSINFASKHGGKIALAEFRDWLSTNVPHLLEGAEFKSINAGAMKSIALNLGVEKLYISELDQSQDINRLLTASFYDWKSGKKDW